MIIVPPSHPTSPVPSNTEALIHPLPIEIKKKYIFIIFFLNNNYVAMQSC
jgi:hypothetical protein